MLLHRQPDFQTRGCHRLCTEPGPTFRIFLRHIHLCEQSSARRTAGLEDWLTKILALPKRYLKILHRYGDRGAMSRPEAAVRHSRRKTALSQLYRAPRSLTGKSDEWWRASLAVAREKKAQRRLETCRAEILRRVPATSLLARLASNATPKIWPAVPARRSS